jgi:hypothetical protein
MIVGVLTTCHTQYTCDSSICIFFFFWTTLQVFVTYLTGALYVQHPLWFYKHQHDNRVRSRLFVACHWWWFQWLFWFVPTVPGYLREEEDHKPDPWRNPIERITHSYLKDIVYDKLLKPRQSFLITLYKSALICICPNIVISSISSTVAASSSIGLTIPEAVWTVMCSWWWAEEPPETCTASVKINKSRSVASCWL